MSAASLVFSVISLLLMGYLVLILIRLLATWFGSASTPPLVEFLARITDPYLNLFRGWRFLRFQYLDLSPLAALIILQLLITVSSRIALERSIWFGLVLSLLLELVGQALGFFFIFFGALAVIRLIAILAKASSVSRVWFTLDHILQPMIYPVVARLSPHRVLPYGTGLGIFIGLNAVAWFLCNLGFNTLAWLSRSIPF
jgi:YggT family protein